MDGYEAALHAEAKARAAAEAAELKRGALRAMLMKAFAETHSSAAAQEREAMASTDYLHHLEEQERLAREWYEARAAVKAMEMHASLYQSAKAYERAELRAYSN